VRVRSTASSKVKSGTNGYVRRPCAVDSC
jgi:hypothetical protein